MAKKSRAQMIAIINSGHSVMCNGSVVSTIEDLPNEVQMVGSDPDKAAALMAKAMLDRAEQDRVIAAMEKILAAKSEGVTAVTPDLQPQTSVPANEEAEDEGDVNEGAGDSADESGAEAGSATRTTRRRVAADIA